jgi:pSer/pThr/pTyr-binding forkhead associated (FHA) protein
VAYLEVWRADARTLTPLAEDRLTVGRSPDNDISLPDDRLVSRLHAVLERFSSGWIIRDLGSRNGTSVNGNRVFSDQRLHSGDELRIGSAKLIFREEGAGTESTVADTGVQKQALTRRERDVLVALCRPVLSGAIFPEPASVKQIAAELYITDAAVKQHLLNLYDKFSIRGEGENRRKSLATEALKSGAVSLADLKDDTAT